MNRTLLAVFGHYDSRGGTTGMPIAEISEAELERAITDYNRVFGWDEMLEEYKKNPTAWTWNPTLPGSSPGDNDLMFIAELWHEDELPDGDLEDAGVVLIDEATEPVLDSPGMQAILMNDRRVAALEVAKKLGDTDSDITLVNKALILAMAEEGKFTQLEFVPISGGKYQAQGDEDDDTWKAKVRTLAKKLTGPEVTDRGWDDDAFGFIIGTGL